MFTITQSGTAYSAVALPSLAADDLLTSMAVSLARPLAPPVGPAAQMEHHTVLLDTWRPRADLYDDAGVLVLRVDLPGVAHPDLTVEVEGRQLVVRGKRARPRGIAAEDYLEVECTTGVFQRTFDLPFPPAPQWMRARLVDGVLEIRISRAASRPAPLSQLQID